MRVPPLTPAGAVLVTLASAVLWGTSFAVNDWGLGHLDSHAFAFLRFVVAATSTLAIARALAGSWRWDIARDPALALLGFATAFSFGFQYAGQEFTTPAKTALLVNSSVILIAILSAVFLKERLPRGAAALVVLAFLGASFLMLPVEDAGDLAASFAGGTLRGDVLVAVSSVATASFMVLNKGVLSKRRYPVLHLAGWTFAWTTLFLAIPFAAAGPARVGAIGTAGWGAILYTGLLCTTAAYALWTWGLTRLGVTASSVILLLEVILAVLISAAFGLDVFAPVNVVGGLVLFAAIAAMTVLGARQAASGTETVPTGLVEEPSSPAVIDRGESRRER